MYKSINAYIDEIEKREIVVGESQERIKKLTEEYKREVDLYLENIRRHNYEIKSVLDMKVKAELTDILSHMAKEWGVGRDEVVVHFHTDYDFSTGNEQYAMHNAKFFNNEKNVSTTIFPFHFVIHKPRKKGEEFSTFETINVCIGLNEDQKDGRVLGEHIFAKAERIANDTIDVSIRIDDINMFILPFKLRELVKQDVVNGKLKYVPRDETSRMILEAVEDYRLKCENKKQEETIEKL